MTGDHYGNSNDQNQVYSMCAELSFFEKWTIQHATLYSPTVNPSCFISESPSSLHFSSVLTTPFPFTSKESKNVVKLTEMTVYYIHAYQYPYNHSFLSRSDPYTFPFQAFIFSLTSCHIYLVFPFSIFLFISHQSLYTLALFSFHTLASSALFSISTLESAALQPLDLLQPIVFSLLHVLKESWRSQDQNRSVKSACQWRLPRTKPRQRFMFDGGDNDTPFSINIIPYSALFLTKRYC